MENAPAPSPLSASAFTGCSQLCSPSRYTHPAESPCSRPCNRNPRITSSTPTTANDRQQYQDWILTLSAHIIRLCPPRYSQPWCPGHKRKNGLASRLYQSFKSSGQPTQERVFGYRTDAFSKLFTGFSICHPMYDNTHMLKVVHYATASASNNQEASASFLLFPNWMENSTNGFHITVTDNKDVCTFLGNIPKRKCATRHSSTSKAKHHPCQKQHGAYASL